MTSLWETVAAQGEAAAAHSTPPAPRSPLVAPRSRLVPRRPARIAARALRAARHARAAEHRHRARRARRRRAPARARDAGARAPDPGRGRRDRRDRHRSSRDLDPAPARRPRRPRAAPRHRMDPADLGHDRRAEAGRAHALEPRRRPAAPGAGARAACGARSTTSAATAACRSTCARCSAACRWCCRARASPSRDFLARAGAARRHPHLRHAVALAPRADERRGAAASRPSTCACRARSPTRVCSTSCARPIPDATIAHAFASTEAGVAFDVDDGLAGFPAALSRCAARGHRAEGRGWDAAHPLATAPPRAIWARPPRRSRARTASSTPATWSSSKDGRYYFRGRRGGVINVGGMKVYPEEVEAVLNADPRVRMSLVRAQAQSDHRRARDRRGGARGRRAAQRSTPRSRDAQERAARALPARAARAQGAGAHALRAAPCR